MLSVVDLAEEEVSFFDDQSVQVEEISKIYIFIPLRPEIDIRNDAARVFRWEVSSFVLSFFMKKRI